MIEDQIPNLRLVYEFEIVAEDNETRIEFENFIEDFGTEGNLMWF